jgi:hypothetical protein
VATAQGVIQHRRIARTLRGIDERRRASDVLRNIS